LGALPPGKTALCSWARTREGATAESKPSGLANEGAARSLAVARQGGRLA